MHITDTLIIGAGQAGINTVIWAAGVGRDACEVADHIDRTTRRITTTPTITSPEQK